MLKILDTTPAAAIAAKAAAGLVIANIKDPDTYREITIDETVPMGWHIVDVVITSSIAEKIKKAKMRLLAGPLSWFEKGFTGTQEMVKEFFLPDQENSLVLGGETAAATHFPRSSTGGGSAIHYLTKGTLPVLEV